MATMNTRIIGVSSKALLKAGLFISFITACILCVNLFGKFFRNSKIIRKVISEKSDFSYANLQKLQKEENRVSEYTGISDEFEDARFDDTQKGVETSFDYAALSAGDTEKVIKTVKEAEEAKCRRLPDIVIVAFEKCGTMTLRQFLAIHPRVYISNNRDNNRLFISEDDDIKVYENISCTPDHKLRLEKLATPTRADLVYKHLPNVKIIAIVREPVERSMSQFLHLTATGKLKKSMTDFEVFAKKVDVPVKSGGYGLRTSYYSDIIRPWVETYGQENILFLDGDEFAKNPVNELQKAEQFIGLRPFITANMFEYNKSRGFYCIKTTRDDGCMYPGKGRPHPVMRAETREKLKKAFRRPNERFFKLIGKRFPWNDK